MRNSKIIAKMRQVFLPEDLEVSAGDFFYPKLDIAGTIIELRTKRTDSCGGNPKLQRDAVDTLHGDLLLFAKSLLEDEPVFYPYAATIAAVVCNDDYGCCPETYVAADIFFAVLAQKCDAADPNKMTAQMKCETYYAAARAFKLESPLSYDLHIRTDALFCELLSHNPPEFWRMFKKCAIHADDFISGEALLLINFDTILREISRKNFAEDATHSSILDNTLHASGVVANMLVDLVDHSILAEPMIKGLGKLWDDLLCIDEELAESAIKNCMDAYAGSSNANSKFVMFVNERAAALKQTREQGLVNSDDLSLPAPHGQDVRQRLMQKSSADHMQGHIAQPR